ncbi:MAG: hypothetical protein ABSG68_18265 [Thermoguttaceae bacterium]
MGFSEGILRLVLVVCLVALLLTTSGAGAETPAAPGLLLLHSGQVIEGRISREGNEYRVEMPDSEVRLRSCEVEFCCRDLEEGYRRKRSLIQPGSLLEHLRLAQWCQRQGLYGYAASELSDAAEIDPRHPGIALIERQLKLAMEKPAEPEKPAAKIAACPTAAELDRMVRGMPPGTVEAFAQMVQPILMNHCMTSGCHSLQSTMKFQLLRVSAGSPPGRRLTQRNLHAVLQWIDRENPAASRLLTVPSVPHGAGKTAIFADHQVVQYRRLAAWVYGVTQHSIPEDILGAVAATDAQSAAGLEDPPQLLALGARARPVPRLHAEAGGGPVRPASALQSHTKAAERLLAAKTHRPGHSKQADDATDSGAEKQAAGAGATDPFDAEVFNRQYAPSAPAADSPMAPVILPTPAPRVAPH